MIKVICVECRKSMKTVDGKDLRRVWVSHGICKKCYSRMTAPIFFGDMKEVLV